MTALLQRFAKDRSGASAIEYGLVAGLVSISIIIALGIMEDGISAMFNAMGSYLASIVVP